MLQSISLNKKAFQPSLSSSDRDAGFVAYNFPELYAQVKNLVALPQNFA